MNKRLCIMLCAFWLVAPAWLRAAAIGRSYSGQVPQGFWIPWTFTLTLRAQTPTPGQVSWSLDVHSAASLPGRDQECEFAFWANGQIFCRGFAHAPWVAGGAVTYNPAAAGVLPCAPGNYLHIQWGPQTTEGFVNGQPETYSFHNELVKLPIQLSNPTSNTVTFQIHTGGALLHTQTLGPGASIAYTQPFEDNGNITITQTVNGLSQDGFGSLYLNPSGNVTSGPLMISQPGPDGTTLYSDNLPPVTVDSEQEPATVWASIVPHQPLVPASQVATSATGGGGYKPIWTNPATVAGYDGATDLLTNAVFREGVQNLINRDNLSESEKMAQRANAAHAANAQVTGSTGEQAAFAASWAENLTAAQPSGLPATLSVPAVAASDASDVFTIALPSRFGGQTINFNPFLSSRLGPILSGFKTALAWLIVVLFAVWCSRRYWEAIREVGKLKQVQGLKIIIAGESEGGLASALTYLGVFLVISFTFVVALAALYDSNWAVIGTISSRLSLHPFAGLPGKVIWFLDNVYPVATTIACLLGRLVFIKIASAAIVAVQAGFRVLPG